MQMEIENYKYTESRGYVLRTYRLEDAGLYICRPVANPSEQELHFQMDVMESCELKLLMNGTNNKCKLGNARRLPPPLLPSTSITRGLDSSSPLFEISNDLPESPPSPSVVHRSLSKTTNARTSRTSRSSNSILNLPGELSSSTTMTTTTEFFEKYTTEFGDEGFDDRTTEAGGGGNGGSRNASGFSNSNRLSSSGVGSRMLGISAGQVTTTGKGSRLDPSASPSVSRLPGRREL